MFYSIVNGVIVGIRSDEVLSINLIDYNHDQIIRGLMSDISPVSLIANISKIPSFNSGIVVSLPSGVRERSGGGDSPRSIPGVVIANDSSSSFAGTAGFKNITVETALGNLVVQGLKNIPAGVKVDVIIVPQTGDNTKIMVVVRDDGDVLFYGNVKSLLQESQQPSAQPQTLAERATSQSDVFVEVSDSKSGIILKARGTLENAAFSVAIEGDENMVEKLGLSALKQDIILLRKNLAADLEANVQKNLSNSGTSNSNKVMGQLQSSLSHNEEMILPLKNGMKIDVAIRLIMTGRDHGDMIPMKFTGSISYS